MRNPLHHSNNFRGGVKATRACRGTRRPFPAFRPAGPTLLAWIALLAPGLFLPACSHWRDAYLTDALQQASQDEVIDRLGEPWKKKTLLLKGQSTWIYRYALTEDELDPMGVNALGQSMRQATDSLGALIGGGGNSDLQNKPKCFHYVLTFNRAKVLKNWGREDCAGTAL